MLSNSNARLKAAMSHALVNALVPKEQEVLCSSAPSGCPRGPTVFPSETLEDLFFLRKNSNKFLLFQGIRAWDKSNKFMGISRGKALFRCGL